MLASRLGGSSSCSDPVRIIVDYLENRRRSWRTCLSLFGRKYLLNTYLINEMITTQVR